MNRCTKGQLLLTMVLKIINLLLVVFVISILKGLIPFIFLVQANTGSIEADLFAHQLINAPRGFALTEAGKPLIGIIDVTKTEGLDQRLAYDKLSARITIYNLTGAPISQSYFAKEKYERWSALVGKKGVGSTEKYEKSFYILYKIKEEVMPGKLTIEMVMSHG